MPNPTGTERGALMFTARHGDDRDARDDARAELKKLAKDKGASDATNAAQRPASLFQPGQ